MSDVCVLSEREVGRFRFHKISPNHYEHQHVSAVEAQEGLEAGAYDFVSDRPGRRYVSPAKEHTLQVKDSGGMPIIQRVVGNGYKHVQEAR